MFHFLKRRESAVVNPALIEAERRIEELQALLRQQVVELENYPQLVAQPAPMSAKPRVVKAPKPAKLSALEFWRLHGQAVDSIRVIHGDSWKIAAPFGETELVTLAAGYKRVKTERGTVLNWSTDQRVPAARYWPGEAFPDGVTVQADYAREDSDFARKVQRSEIKPAKREHLNTRMIAWRADHEEWISVEREFKRIAALEAACLEYGPQPLACVDLAEAAD